MPPALDESIRERHMLWAVTQGYPRIKYRPMTNQTMQIIGYGPSLEDTWRKIDQEKPLITTSGALRFLIGKGLTPVYGKWFHAHVDPRLDNLQSIQSPQKDVVYLMGSCAHPEMFKALDGYHVALWHGTSGRHTRQWILENDPEQVLVTAGSTVGISAIHLGGVFGFQHFEIHGMDGSFKGDARHAGPHGGFIHGQRPSTLNPAYMTSRLMDNANVEIISMIRNFPVFCVFHGDGVMQDWVRKNKPLNAACDMTPEADSVRNMKYVEITHKEAQVLRKQGMPIVQQVA